MHEFLSQLTTFSCFCRQPQRLMLSRHLPRCILPRTFFPRILPRLLLVAAKQTPPSPASPPALAAPQRKEGGRGVKRGTAAGRGPQHQRKKRSCNGNHSKIVCNSQRQQLLSSALSSSSNSCKMLLSGQQEKVNQLLGPKREAGLKLRPSFSSQAPEQRPGDNSCQKTLPQQLLLPKELPPPPIPPPPPPPSQWKDTTRWKRMMLLPAPNGQWRSLVVAPQAKQGAPRPPPTAKRIKSCPSLPLHKIGSQPSTPFPRAPPAGPRTNTVRSISVPKMNLLSTSAPPTRRQRSSSPEAAKLKRRPESLLRSLVARSPWATRAQWRGRASSSGGRPPPPTSGTSSSWSDATNSGCRQLLASACSPHPHLPNPPPRNTTPRMPRVSVLLQRAPPCGQRAPPNRSGAWWKRRSSTPYAKTRAPTGSPGHFLSSQTRHYSAHHTTAHCPCTAQCIAAVPLNRRVRKWPYFFMFWSTFEPNSLLVFAGLQNIWPNKTILSPIWAPDTDFGVRFVS